MSNPQRIYFDGTAETAGQLLFACAVVNRPVVIVIERNTMYFDFLEGMEDCTGSIGDWKNGRYIPRVCHGSARFCKRVAEDGVEAFFKHAADVMDDRSEEEAFELLSMVRACHGKTCGRCEQCRHVRSVAEDYGFYDVLEAMKDEN